ncbi:hypothetical protein Q5752_006138 [Cryptotrichosporon argae]
MPLLEKVSSNRVSTGTLTKYKFPSAALGGLSAQCNVFVPAAASRAAPVPVLFYLAGLTCNEDTGAQKGGFLNTAGEEGIAVVFPDTSPRGAGVDGEDDDWQLGTGAGFYMNATDPKWAKHYNMYDHVVKELPAVLKVAELGLDFSRWSVFGHSMGGHGALTIYLKTPELFRSCSAFAAASNPSRTPWGINAFTNYLAVPAPAPGAPPPAEWLTHDATHLLSSSRADAGALRILSDYGGADQFLANGQLEPAALEAAARDSGHNGVRVRVHHGFDHSYYFVSTFAPEHVRFHAQFLKA